MAQLKTSALGANLIQGSLSLFQKANPALFGKFTIGFSALAKVFELGHCLTFRSMYQRPISTTDNTE